MKPKVNQELCIGCGTCESVCPEVFKMKDDGKAHVTEDADFEKSQDCIKQAIDSCAVQAISEE